MKNRVAFLVIIMLVLAGCSSTNKSEKKGALLAQQSEPEYKSRDRMIQALFYQNGDYKPLTITFNETGLTARQDVSYLYFIKMELGKNGVYLTYIYNDMIGGQNKKIMKSLTKEQYITIMEHLFKTGVLELLVIEQEDPAAVQEMQEANLLEFSLELKVLRLYYTPADIEKANFRQYKKIIDSIKEIDTYLR